MTSSVTISNHADGDPIKVISHQAILTRRPGTDELSDVNPLNDNVTLKAGEKATWSVWNGSHLLIQEVPHK